MTLVNDSQEKIKILKMHKVLILTYYHPVIDRLLMLWLLYWIFLFVKFLPISLELLKDFNAICCNTGQDDTIDKIRIEAFLVFVSK